MKGPTITQVAQAAAALVFDNGGQRGWGNYEPDDPPPPEVNPQAWELVFAAIPWRTVRAGLRPLLEMKRDLTEASRRPRYDVASTASRAQEALEEYIVVALTPAETPKRTYEAQYGHTDIREALKNLKPLLKNGRPRETYVAYKALYEAARNAWGYGWVPQMKQKDFSKQILDDASARNVLVEVIMVTVRGAEDRLNALKLSHPASPDYKGSTTDLGRHLREPADLPEESPVKILPLWNFTLTLTVRSRNRRPPKNRPKFINNLNTKANPLFSATKKVRLNSSHLEELLKASNQATLLKNAEQMAQGTHLVTAGVAVEWQKDFPQLFGAGLALAALDQFNRDIAIVRWDVWSKKWQVSNLGKKFLEMLRGYSDPASPDYKGAAQVSEPSIEAREAGPSPKRKPTFAKARQMAYAALEGAGWTVVPQLQTPHATDSGRKYRLYFKPQALHLAPRRYRAWHRRGGDFRPGDARSTFIDIRDHTPESFLKALGRWVP